MRFKKEITTLILTFMAIIGYGQQVDFVKRTKEEAVVYEKQQGGVLVDSLSDYGILINPIYDKFKLVQTKVLLFKRTGDSFDPQLHVWYHFDQDFQKIKGIRYNWGLYNPSFNAKKQAGTLQKLSKDEKVFVKKYKSLQKELEKKFGKPIKINTIADNADRFSESVFWEDKEQIVGLSIVFTRKLKEIPDYGLEGDYKVEVMVTFK